MTLDEAIVHVYSNQEHPTTADRINANRQLSVEFVLAVNNLTGTDFYAPDDVRLRLIGLRKLGADKGGLPRLFRKYNGRTVA
jgi:hypothetical protein